MQQGDISFRVSSHPSWHVFLFTHNFVYLKMFLHTHNKIEEYMNYMV